MPRTVTIEDLRRWLDRQKNHPEHIRLFVMGHAAPDTDTVISALGEALRRTALGETGVAPLVQGEVLPREIAWLLGDVGPQLLLSANPAVQQRLSSPTVGFVLTDHQEEAALADRVVAILDHHPRLPGLVFSTEEVELKPVGAATSLVALRWQRDGLAPDSAVARLLLGGILADTDGLSPAKARPEDNAAAAWLVALSGADPDALFAALHRELLAETDPKALFFRDYRAFDGLGFAILKVWRKNAPDAAALRALLQETREARRLTLALAKVVLYEPDGTRQEVFFLDAASASLCAQVRALLSSCVPTGEAVTAPDGGLYLPKGVGLSRKGLVPRLLPLLKAGDLPSR